jgi:Tol biopolymer transport system component
LPAKNLLVFAALRSARPDMWVRDLRTNKERVLVANAVPHRVSSDGEWVGYHDLGTTRIFEVPVGGGKPAELCPHCMFWDWSVNRRRIVHVKSPRDVPPAVWLWDVASQEDSVLIRDPEYSIYMPNISPDGHWIAFMAMMGQRGAGIFVAPFQDRPVERRQWLGINESAGLNEDPSWSPSGRVLYFESRRDGSHCVWAQRLDPATKLPVGDPVEVFHSRLQLSLHNPSAVSVSRDQLVMTLVERSGNIWIQELAAAKR